MVGRNIKHVGSVDAKAPSIDQPDSVAISQQTSQMASGIDTRGRGESYNVMPLSCLCDVFVIFFDTFFTFCRKSVRSVFR